MGFGYGEDRVIALQGAGRRIGHAFISGSLSNLAPAFAALPVHGSLA
jgi:hypothetical protein